MTIPDALADDLVLAHRLATLAREIALHHVQRGVVTRLKSDGTPVSEADVEIEQALKQVLAQKRPGDAVHGEELGASGTSSRQWLIDPIDGTSNFASGKVQWGTHVALLERGHVLLGVITRPLLGRTWSASRGAGAYRTDAGSSHALPLRVSLTSEINASRVTFWSDQENAIVARLKRNTVWVEPELDAILRLAEGEIDGVIDPSGKPWDHAPAVVIVEEAGGRFSDPAGGQRLDLGEGRYSNGAIHSQLCQLVEP